MQQNLFQVQIKFEFTRWFKWKTHWKFALHYDIVIQMKSNYFSLYLHACKFHPLKNSFMLHVALNYICNFLNPNIYLHIFECKTNCLPMLPLRKWMSENPLFTEMYTSSTVSVTVLVLGVPSSEKTWSKYLSWSRIICW